MATHRKVLASLVVVFIIVGHFNALIKKRERWPFSHYPMFSYIMTDYREGRAIGITEDGQEVELFASIHLKPLLDTRVSMSVLRAINKHGADSPDTKALLQKLLDLYELRRPEHGGPPLRGLRIYEYTWLLDPYKDVTFEANGRELLVEYDRND